MKGIGAYKMFAIVETGGKQYKVSEGDIIFVEKLGIEEGETYTFEKVLALSDENGFVAGTPTVAATVTAKANNIPRKAASAVSSDEISFNNIVTPIRKEYLYSFHSSV